MQMLYLFTPAIKQLERFIISAALQDNRNLERLNYLAKLQGQVEGVLDAIKKGEEKEPINTDDLVQEFSMYDCFKLVGEAAKKIPQDIKDKYPQIPWREFTIMRDAVAHWNVPEKRKELEDYYARRKDMVETIAAARDLISDITLKEDAPEKETRALKELKYGINRWAGLNAVRFGGKERILKVLKEEEKDLFTLIFENPAYVEFKANQNFMQIVGGNIAQELSPFFHKFVSDRVGFSSMPSSWKEIRDHIAHNDLEYQDEKDLLVPRKSYSYHVVRDGVKAHASENQLAHIYYNRIVRGLSSDKIAVLQEAVSKLPSTKIPEKRCQQQAFVLALAEVAKDMGANSLEELAKQCRFLAEAKLKYITIEEPGKKKMRAVLKPFRDKLVKSMQASLGIGSSQQVS